MAGTIARLVGGMLASNQTMLNDLAAMDAAVQAVASNGVGATQQLTVAYAKLRATIVSHHANFKSLILPK